MSPARSAFLGLWETRTGLQVHKVIFPDTMDTSSTIPFWYFEGRCAPLPYIFNLNAKAKDSLQALLSIQSGDTLWVVNEFLAVEYPNGGQIDARHPNSDPHSMFLWKKLQRLLNNKHHTIGATLTSNRFCAKSEFCHHPRIIELGALCKLAHGSTSDTTRSTSTMLSAIELLRPPVTKYITSRTRVYTIAAATPTGAVSKSLTWRRGLIVRNFTR